MTIKNWLNTPFELLESVKEKWMLILTTGIFAILFFNLYNPFNVSNWHTSDSFPLFIILSSYGIIGILILATSQFLIRPLFAINKFKIKSFILWFVCEIMILGLVMFLIYGEKNLTEFDLFIEYLRSLKYTFLVISLPYAAVIYYLYTHHQKEKLLYVDKSDDQIIKILDEKQNVKIAIEPEKLLYIKNADNYVEIFYSNDDGVKKELVRTSLKRLEKELSSFRIIRCHRSYMVNLKNVSFSKKTRQGLNLQLKGSNIPEIPVSRNYVSIILDEL